MTNAKPVQLGARTCLLCQLLSPAAFAESDSAAAQRLFEQGRELLAAGNAEAACPKLEESVRLELATGALLALAMCHEQAGKFATAWAEYERVARRAAQGGQAEREQWASERVTALRPLLSTLNVQISDDLARLPGLQVWCDERLLGSRSWNVAVPFDGGTHRLKVTAPAHEPWETTLVLRSQGDAQVLEVPLLSPLQVNERLASRPATTPRAEWSHPPEVAETSSPSSSQLWGMGLVGASLASFATSGVMLYRATTLSGKSDSALAWGDGATYFAVGGGALAAAGAALLIWGEKAEVANPTSKLSLTVSPTAMAFGLGASF